MTHRIFRALPPKGVTSCSDSLLLKSSLASTDSAVYTSPRAHEYAPGLSGACLHVVFRSRARTLLVCAARSNGLQGPHADSGGIHSSCPERHGSPGARANG